MTWTAPAMLDALKERLDEWPGLNDVEVFTEPWLKYVKTENIVFTRVPGDQDWAGLGRGSKKDRYRLEGFVLVARKGATRVMAKQARDRAYEIVDELAKALREFLEHLPALASDVGANQITKLAFVRANLDQGGTPGQNRWAQVDFDIEVEARI